MLIEVVAPLLADWRLTSRIANYMLCKALARLPLWRGGQMQIYYQRQRLIFGPRIEAGALIYRVTDAQRPNVPDIDVWILAVDRSLRGVSQ